MVILLIGFPSNVFGQQGQLLQAEPSKVAMQALEFFPTVVKQLRPDYQKHIKKTAEHYKTNS
jgi:hypothetical protein